MSHQFTRRGSANVLNHLPGAGTGRSHSGAAQASLATLRGNALEAPNDSALEDSEWLHSAALCAMYASAAEVQHFSPQSVSPQQVKSASGQPVLELPPQLNAMSLVEPDANGVYHKINCVASSPKHNQHQDMFRYPEGSRPLEDSQEQQQYQQQPSSFCGTAVESSHADRPIWANVSEGPGFGAPVVRDLFSEASVMDPLIRSAPQSPEMQPYMFSPHFGPPVAKPCIAAQVSPLPPTMSLEPSLRNSSPGHALESHSLTAAPMFVAPSHVGKRGFGGGLPLSPEPNSGRYSRSRSAHAGHIAAMGALDLGVSAVDPDTKPSPWRKVEPTGKQGSTFLRALSSDSGLFHSTHNQTHSVPGGKLEPCRTQSSTRVTRTVRIRLDRHRGSETARRACECAGDIRAEQICVEQSVFSFFDLRAAAQAVQELNALNLGEVDFCTFAEETAILQHLLHEQLVCKQPVHPRPWKSTVSLPPDKLVESGSSVNQGTLVAFNIDSSVPADAVVRLFEAYGEVFEIREAASRRNHRFVEFYDVRDCERALDALNKTEFNGRKLKIEFSRNGAAQSHRVGSQCLSSIRSHGRASSSSAVTATPGRSISREGVSETDFGELDGRQFTADSFDINSQTFSGTSSSIVSRAASSSSQAPTGTPSRYTLDIHRILDGQDRRTSLMIRNIPNKYTQRMLLAAIEAQHLGRFDFFYLPIDFKNRCNVVSFVRILHQR